MIRFVLHPGFVVSPNDGDLHRISAPVLADLYGVSLSECIVVDEDRPETLVGLGELTQYLHLFPSDQGAAYWKISDVERRQYPLEVTSISSPIMSRVGPRRIATLNVFSLKDLYWAIKRALS